MSANLTPDRLRQLEAMIRSGMPRQAIIDSGFGENTVRRHLKRIEGEQKKSTSPGLSEQIHDLLKKSRKKWSVEALSDHFNVGIGKIREAVGQMRDVGKNVDVSDGVELLRDIPQTPPTSIDVLRFKGRTIRFGLTADNHLGSRYARLDVLNALFDIWKEQEITDVYQLGNMIDGDARFNKFDLLVHGMEDQVNYFIENWPKREGVTTHFITGDDHEGWYVQREGVNIGKMIQSWSENAGRNDLRFLGHMEHDIVLKAERGETIMRLVHAGGGSAYATSYAPQKIVESYQGGEKPNILLIGHYHKAEYGYPREVHTVQCGTTEDQTPFMRKLKIQAHVGGWTISFDLDDDGLVHAFTPQFHPFYDRGFYEGGQQWNYRWRRNKAA